MEKEPCPPPPPPKTSLESTVLSTVPVPVPVPPLFQNNFYTTYGAVYSLLIYFTDGYSNVLHGRLMMQYDMYSITHGYSQLAIYIADVRIIVLYN